MIGVLFLIFVVSCLLGFLIMVTESFNDILFFHGLLLIVVIAGVGLMLLGAA